MLFELGANNSSYWTKRRRADQLVKSWHSNESGNPTGVVNEHFETNNPAEQYLMNEKATLLFPEQRCCHETDESCNRMLKSNDNSAMFEMSENFGPAEVRESNVVWPNNLCSSCEDSNCQSYDEESHSSSDEVSDLTEKLAEWALECKFFIS